MEGDPKLHLSCHNTIRKGERVWGELRHFLLKNRKSLCSDAARQRKGAEDKIGRGQAWLIQRMRSGSQSPREEG